MARLRSWSGSRLPAMIAWRWMPYDAQRRVLDDTLFRVSETAPLDTLPTAPPGSFTDPGAVGRVVDAIYMLHREPGRHAVAFADGEE